MDLITKVNKPKNPTATGVPNTNTPIKKTELGMKNEPRQFETSNAPYQQSPAVQQSRHQSMILKTKSHASTQRNHIGSFIKEINDSRAAPRPPSFSSGTLITNSTATSNGQTIRNEPTSSHYSTARNAISTIRQSNSSISRLSSDTLRNDMKAMSLDLKPNYIRNNILTSRKKQAPILPVKPEPTSSTSYISHLPTVSSRTSKQLSSLQSLKDIVEASNNETARIVVRRVSGRIFLKLDIYLEIDLSSLDTLIQKDRDSEVRLELRLVSGCSAPTDPSAELKYETLSKSSFRLLSCLSPGKSVIEKNDSMATLRWALDIKSPYAAAIPNDTKHPVCDVLEVRMLRDSKSTLLSAKILPPCTKHQMAGWSLKVGYPRNILACDR